MEKAGLEKKIERKKGSEKERKGGQREKERKREREKKEPTPEQKCTLMDLTANSDRKA